ncbi:MAG: DoxX family membrane protein [Kiritimatiellae bacterium]|nr:DoxX family membrane protein [Kiritimatiellia bacterium]
METFGLLARIAVTMLFLYAGWTKVVDVEGFARAIEGYGMLPVIWIPPLAYFLPWLEIWCAVALWITPPFRTSAWWLFVGMMLVFTIAKASAMSRGLDISCGCTGSEDPMSWLDVGINLIWLGVSFAGLILDKRRY